MNPVTTDYSIERDENITTIRLHRELTLDEVLDVVDQVAQSDVSNRRLWDLTRNFVFTSAEIAQIAERGKTHWPSASRVAYVAADDLSFGLLRMFEVYREQENYETRVFREEQGARDWLKEWVE